MKKSSHSKIKNTAILFELLTRQIASDTVSGVDESPAIKIIKEFFKGNTLLAKELSLYQTLVTENYKSTDKASYLIDAVIASRRKLDIKKLKEEKYCLVKEISRHYDAKTFFKTSVSDYKLFASMYRIFEGTSFIDPKELVNSRFTIIEHITNKKKFKHTGDENFINEYRDQSEDIRMLAYKLLVDKFNEKYKNLSVKQKDILREYINNVSNTTTLREYVQKEALLLQESLHKSAKRVKDKVLQIKINEVCNLLDKYKSMKTIQEKNVLSLLLYHELQKELSNANK